MSKFEFKLPDIGEGVTEGEIVNWLVGVGDGVKEDQDLVEVMTDKATVTIGAPKAGKIAELKGEVGDVVPVGQVLVVFDVADGGGEAKASEGKSSEGKSSEGKSSEAKPAAAAKAAPAPPSEAAAKAEPAEAKETKASAVGDIKEELPGMSSPSSNGASRGEYYNDKPLAAPATRKLARELDVDLRRGVRARAAPRRRASRGGEGGRTCADSRSAQARVREHGALEAHRRAFHLLGGVRVFGAHCAARPDQGFCGSRRGQAQLSPADHQGGGGLAPAPSHAERAGR
jgi:pyruvate/2-oxoglutarate dehydrogenase complex dihydrolipoamide acyltransferase (E2) component